MSARQRCKKTGKRRYRDHDEAVGSLRLIGKVSKRDTKPVRAYPCDACDGWHITSQAVWGQAG